jgi:predicted chitinase
LGLDLLANPDRVAQSNRIAAATAIWYYTATGMNIPAAQGNFANTTRILNIYECTGHPGQNLQASRVATYQFVRKCFGLAPATQNLYC